MSTTALSPSRPAAEIVPFRPETHLQGAVEALLRLRRAERLYPPPSEAEATIRGFAYWLLGEDVLSRWAALVDGRVAGYIEVTAPRPYLAGTLSKLGQELQAPGGFCEVSRFFVDLGSQRKGVGTVLFDTALSFARGMALQPALAVPGTCLAARRLYVRHGMTEVGSFRGIHGQNFLFVDLASAAWYRETAVTARAA